MESPAPGEEQDHRPVQIRDCPAGKYHCGKGPWSAGGLGYTQDSNVPFWARRQMVSLCALRRLWPAGGRRFSSSSTLP